MPNFRWPLVYHNISLAKEVYLTHPEKPSDWEVIPAKLSALFSKKDDKIISLKGRGCQEHLDLLIKKYKEEDKKSIKAVCCCSFTISMRL